MMKKYKKYLIILVVLIFSVTLFYNKVYIPKTTFETVSPNIGELKVVIMGIGHVDAKDIYLITAQTGGKIVSINTDEGGLVKKGDLIVEMDGVDLPQQLEAAKATLKKVQYDKKASKDELINQKTKKKLLEITYNRYAKLKEQKFVSQAEYDKAKADLDGINASINATTARMGSAKATAIIAMKNMDVIRAKIDRLNVYSPIDGYVISKDAQVAQNVTPSISILKIVDPKTLWIKAKIDERISSKIRVNQSATITLRSQPNKVYKGVVKRIGSISDAVTLEREVYISFLNTPKPFYINEQAEVKIAIKKFTNVVKIPSKVTVQNGGKFGVWIVQDSKAKFKVVDKIAQNDDEIAVKNFSKELKIIVPNRFKKPLKNGMKIHL